MNPLEFPLETELLELLGTERDARIIARHLGLDGHADCSFRRAGAEFSLSGERIRQIVSTAFQRSAATEPPVARTLDAVIEFAGRQIPGVAEDIEEAICSRRLATGRFRLEGVINAARLFGRPVPFSLVWVRQRRMLLAKGFGASKPIGLIARKVITTWGMTTIPRLAEVVNARGLGEVEVEILAGLLMCEPGFQWLDQRTGWFTIMGVSNRVLRRIAKILTIAPRISAGNLLAALLRSHRMRGFDPPSSVFLELCRHSKGLRVDGEVVSAERAIDKSEVLSGIERALVGVLSQQPGMTRRELEEICGGLGVKRFTLHQHLTYSPVVSKQRGKTTTYRLLESDCGTPSLAGDI